MALIALILEIIGAGAIAAAAFMVSVPLGFVTLGLAALLFGLALDPPRKES